ncbi:kinase [Hirsutella rhossiliensis]|uniref:Kinase n=1 Tax=Hirsutella rhossiliensis TaxID=111463 RepID=A0A9P8N7C0_9HYPO|nr:kinase [Hirsutella rhossiliensis]KAH0965967.1 kinase [Hirsutella rhossiliensis]
MSTPTTTVATLPRYHSHSHYHHPPPYPHQTPTQSQHHSSNALGSAANYCSLPGFVLPPATPSSTSSSAAAAAAAAAARLLPFYQPVSNAASSSTDALAPSSVAQLQSSAPPRPPPHGLHRSLADDHHKQQIPSPAPRHLESHSSTMSSTAALNDQPSRKRRRSREPDWNTFYRNGLPSEVIVIDDTPEPEANMGRKMVNAAPRDLTTQQPAKRMRRDDVLEATPRNAGYHVQYAASHNNTPLQNSTPIGSTLSSVRTNSALHTTAPTSLSSNSQYEDVQAPLKRKRTRQQVANEAKRRDVDGLGDAFFTYKPPPYSPKKASDVHVRVVHDRLHDKNYKVDDEDGHYIVVPDAELTDKYQITRLLGQGTFGKVVQARDRRRNKLVAIKIIRSVQKYRDASRIELRVLATLKANDEENRNRCIHLRDCFDYRGHICIVMDLLGQSVFDFLKGNSFVPFPNSQIQSFARQLFTSVAFLHDLNLIHTDLKPENILFRQATQRRVLLDTEIRLIDFGSATFQDEYHSSVVSTRHYRAPEIILGLGWSYPCDIWSIGCILVEFFTGDALFQTHDNLEHLAMMEAVVGRRIDPYLVQAVNKMSTRSGGNPASKYFKRLKLSYPTPETTRGSRRFVKAMKHLNDVIPSNTAFFKNFLDLLSKIFVYDPAQRITAKEALNHPWFKEMAVPDDGTEAAKIRLERRRAEQEHLRQAHYVG